jgi:hypothetical protein
MRKKTVTFDDTPFTISPLNLDQVESFINETVLLSPNQQEQPLEIIRTALNNAEPEKPWTIELLRKELDLPAMQFLFREILQYSGLSTAQVTATN